ncbi:MAG: carboxypeptidase regulatory-like domain-containing protein [Bacteroidia bacterium]|nr:carboxypeptidase regulatory-like domain-containing protein [Bacteroidia bacterium]
MTRTYKALTFLIAITLFFGCKKDSETFIPNDEKEHSTSIIGFVNDQNNQPVSNAIVAFDGKTATTDQYGYYEFNDVRVGSQHNFLTIKKGGYFDGCRTFRTNNNSKISLESQLVRAEFKNTFSSSTSATITEGDVQLVFQPNTIVTDKDKNNYSGEVQVAVYHIDPTTSASRLQMPGDLTSVTSDGELQTLTSFGMVYVRLQSPSGEKLQIKPGETVELSASIPVDLLSDAQNEIPMWSFDNSSGAWVEEGTAQKVGSRYVANVSHFSCWNYDYNEPSVVVCGRLVDQNGDPISKAHLLISELPSGWGGHGYVNGDGTFCGRVTKGKKLYVFIINHNPNCANRRIKVGEIGPFNVDTKIGDIKADLSKYIQSLKVIGEFEDCNGAKIQNGFAKVDGVTFTITSGKVNGVIPYCGNIPSSVTVNTVDRKNLKTNDFTGTVVNDTLNLGLVTICGAKADFIQVKSSNLNYDEVFLDNVFVGFSADSSHLSGNLPGWKSWITLQYDNGGLDQGTFTVDQAQLQLGENNGATGYPKYYFDGTGSITITKNQTDKVYEGSYSVTVTEEGTTTTETFTGNFRKKY